MTTPFALTGSAFGWLDHDERASARLREVLSAFEEKSTLDNLGLGVIRDAFSDRLFPGTSTIQTRARYFLFVPWICRQLETEQVSPGAFPTVLRQREVQLLEALCLREGANQGVIGYLARQRVQRLPSSIYWSGLFQLGVRLNQFSLAEYQTRLPDFHAANAADSRDDDNQRLRRALHNWDPGLPSPPKRFLHEPISFEMTREEADYLADRIRMSASGSLFALLVDAPALLTNAHAPWEIDRTSLSGSLRDLVAHAERFSTALWGARLLYNLLLVAQSREVLQRDFPETEASIRRMLAEWRDLMTARRAEFARWAGDMPAFWIAVGRPVSQLARTFVERWIGSMLRDPARIIDDPMVHRDIVTRERALKGRLARLSNRAALESWRGQPMGTDRMNFRWNQGVAVLRDIHHGRRQPIDVAA
jgi:hypothetical protein